MPNLVSANKSDSLASKHIMQRVLEHVEDVVNPDNKESIHITVLPFDSRIKVHKCKNELNVEFAPNRSYTRQFPVKVECSKADKPFKMFVNVQVTEYVEVIVAKTNIPKGITIDDDMIRVAKVEKHRVKTRSSDDMSNIIGGRALRNFSRGYQIGALDVCLVCKGDEVAIIAQSEAITIKTSGTAIESGAMGETIQVKNNSSNRIIKGVIGELREIYVKL